MQDTPWTYNGFLCLHERRFFDMYCFVKHEEKGWIAWCRDRYVHAECRPFYKTKKAAQKAAERLARRLYR